MILLIDAGNTRLKWCSFEQGQFLAKGSLVHEGNLSPELLRQLWGSITPPSAVWGVNVAGQQLAEQINQWTVLYWGLTSNFVTPSRQVGDVVNGYSEPEKLGADRWMGLVGAAHISTGACCVADCGSAVTVDCMDTNHLHLGGLIVPGLMMMARCVSENTAQVAFTAGEPAWLGRDTASCLASGAAQSIVGALQRTAQEAENRFAYPVTRIITGGDAPRLLPWLGEGWRYEPELIFIGLAATIQHYKG